MSQDKPVLSREQIEELRGNLINRYVTSVANVYPTPVMHINILCDLALSALDRQGPASGSPDLVGRLERYEASHRVSGNTNTADTFKEAAQALRTLEAERDSKDTVPRSRYDACNADWLAAKAELDKVVRNATKEIESLQHQLDQRNEWLREALDKWQEWVGKPPQIGSNAVAAERIAQIRKEAFGELPWCTCPLGQCTPDDAAKRCKNFRHTAQT
jgi:hypothetical protein